MRFKRHRDLGNYRMGQLTSLIDVVFLLLIFFMVTASFNAAESELDATLEPATAGTAGNTDLQPQVIHVRLDPQGTITYTIGANTFRRAGALAIMLGRLPHESGVFVRADDNVPWRGPAAALQAAQDAGFTKVTYVPDE